jgi:hypothetical protein
MMNRLLPAHHSRDGRLNSWAARLKTRCISFIAASTPENWTRVRTARRGLEFNASLALVV